MDSRKIRVPAIACHCGEDALKFVERQKSNFDLLLTDVVLPLYSGPELALSVAKVSPSTRILFMSAHTNERIIRNQFRIEPNGFLQKPFSLDELIRVVKKILTEKRPGDYLDANRSS